jgi:hypothetical protein
MDQFSGSRHGAPRSGRLRRLLLASTGLVAAMVLPAPLQAGTAASAGSAEQSSVAADQQHQDIVVTAPLFRDVRPERSLDEQGVASYGVSTVDELVGELESELDSDEDPVFLVNGERVYNLDDIGAYPVEIIRQLEVLPRGSATRVGGSPTQRVFSLTLHRRVRSATATAASRIATEGDWHALRGETILTSVDGRSRGNIALRARDESSLLESERGIIQPVARPPFAARGNVLAYPDLSGEIDPLLSDAAGEVVTVAPIPGSGSPTLADFAAHANDPNVTDAGAFRTLRPSLRSYDFDATYTTPLAHWLTSTTTLRLGKSTSESLIGPATGLFVLGPDNPASPFSQPVDLAIAAETPLRSRYRRSSGEANVTLTAHLGGSWSATLNGRHSEVSELTRTQRSDSSAVPLDDGVNPFTADLGDLIGITTDRASSRVRTTAAQLTVTGSPLHLPAGDVNASLEGRLALYSVHSESSFAGQPQSIRRSEQSGRASLDIPIASRRNGFLPQLGELSASVEYNGLHYSDSGSAYRTAFGLTWEPLDALRLRASIEKAKDPAPIELLGAPTIVTPLVRVFDPLTGQTVDVTFISGGNRALKSQTTETRRLSAILRLVPSLGLQLNGDYTDIRNRNFVSALPPASEAVMLAFPERFIRDSDGTLTQVDVRPVNFANHRQQRLRWGFSLNAPLGGKARPGFAASATGENEESTEQAAVAAAAAAAKNPPVRLQLTANHTIVFKDEILIRTGLDPVDLLGGGGIGIAGGRIRHQFDATAAITSGGTGIRVGATWLGASRLDTRLGAVTDTVRFSPIFTFNLRAFADMRRILPRSAWARGLRLSLDVVNLTNDRQRVRDSAGNTPLQYQPAYRDPIGRTIELEIRKVF